MKPLSSTEKPSPSARKDTLIDHGHCKTWQATSVVDLHSPSSYKIRRSCSVSTLIWHMWPKLSLQVIFLPLGHRSVQQKISIIPPYFSHTKQPFDFSLNISPLCRHCRSTLPFSKNARRPSQ